MLTDNDFFFSSKEDLVTHLGILSFTYSFNKYLLNACIISNTVLVNVLRMKKDDTSYQNKVPK